MTTWAILDGVDAKWNARFDHVIAFEGPHPRRLNELARRVALVAADDDDLLFIDGDAFPVRSIDALMCSRHDVPLVAVRRDENLGDPQPHPCFCLTTVGFWKHIEGDWRVGYRWTNADGDEVTDVGGNLLGILRAANIAWRPLTRCNTNELHPLWFGVYGDDIAGPIVYHHGAGFRSRVARVDRVTALSRSSQFLARVPMLGRWIQRNDAARADAALTAWEASEGQRQVELANEVFAHIEQDPHFYTRFTGA